jgi:hypothetical protein
MPIDSVSGCTPPSTTTTTTAAPPTYDFYLATVYECTGCTPVSTNVPVCLISGTTPNFSEYYITGLDPTHSYKLTATSTTAISTVLFTTSYATCPAACLVAGGA